MNYHFVYDLAKDIWESGEPLPSNIYGHRLVETEGKIYCIGGGEKPPAPSGKMYMLDLADNLK